MTNSSSANAFVGRDRELTTLAQCLRDCSVARRASIVVISGEPGIGKSALVQRTLEDASAKGWTVLLGHAYDNDGMPPYLPFREALQTYVRAAPLDTLRAQVGSRQNDLAQLLPVIRERLPELPGEDGAEAAPGTRYRLFEAFSDFLADVAASSDAGAVLCIEDLHWADDATLLLLEHLARSKTLGPVMILTTLRQAGLGPATSPARTLELLVRDPSILRLELDCLSQADVVEMLAVRGGSAPPEAVADVVYAETEGNPFFVQEVVRFLEGEGRLFDSNGAWLTSLHVGEAEVPQSVRLVIERRLSRVSDDTRRFLTLAALIGTVADYQLVRALAQLDEEHR
jgi:predicted ATPase